MRTNSLFTLAAAALLAVSTASPVLAQDRGNDRRSNDRSARSAQPANQGHDTRANRPTGDVAVRRAEPRAEVSRGNNQVPPSRTLESRGYNAGPAAERRDNARPTENRGYNAGPTAERRDYARPTENRGYNAGPAAERRDYARPTENRGGGNRGYDNRSYDNHGYAYNNRGYENRGYDNRSYGYGYYDNSWRSHIRFGLGISIFAGSPFSFRFEYGWHPNFAYRYTMRPGMAYGGMSFLIDPDFADVYIDGEFVGNARDFGGQPVPVAVGFHRIELYAQGFEPVGFDVNVFPGQVIPYRGTLNPGYR